MDILFYLFLYSRTSRDMFNAKKVLSKGKYHENTVYN